MKIGNVDLGQRPVLLAPMEDVTDVSFRILCREQGADMVYTEFIPSDGLIRDATKALAKMDPIQNLIDENNLNSLLNNLSKFNFEDLNEIPIQTLENVIYYFIHKIQNEQNIPLDKIISIFKKIMIGLKNKIANDCKENLEHTLKKILNDLNMKEDNVIEIKLILSYLKN